MKQECLQTRLGFGYPIKVLKKYGPILTAKQDDEEEEDIEVDVADVLFVAEPTYENSASGQVSVREWGDAVNIRGELKWCPKYPMYRQLSEPQGASAPPLAPAQVNVDKNN